MKKLFASISILSLILASCGSDADKKAQLEADIKAKQAEMAVLNKEITEMEIELTKISGKEADMGKPVKITAINPVTFTHSIDIQGHVDAEESVTVGPQMPGLVKRVNVQVGDKVSAGQVLAELDADAMIQQLNALKVQRDLAKQVYERQGNLWKEKIGTEIQYMQSKAQYEALESQVSSLQEQIAMARITAPIAGVVDQVNLKTGEMAMAGFSNILIVNTNKLRVKAEVAEGHVSKVKTGNTVDVYLPDADTTIQATITYKGNMISKMNRTFTVEVALRPNEKRVVPNMVAVLKINDYVNPGAITAPLSCIQQTAGGKNFVYVAVKNKDGKLVAEKRDITYDKTYNGVAEITSGLRPGDLLITEGFSELNPGDIVAGK
jgi:membrane fusion protein, multidrug efflux system